MPRQSHPCLGGLFESDTWYPIPNFEHFSRKSLDSSRTQPSDIRILKLESDLLYKTLYVRTYTHTRTHM